MRDEVSELNNEANNPKNDTVGKKIKKNREDMLSRKLPTVEIEKIKEQLKRIDELLEDIRKQNVFGIDPSQPTFNLVDASIEAQKDELKRKQLDVRKRLSIFHDFTDIQALQIVFIDDEEEQEYFKQHFTGPEPDENDKDSYKKELYQRKLRTIEEILKNKDDFKQLIQEKNPFYHPNPEEITEEQKKFLANEVINISDDLNKYFKLGVLDLSHYSETDKENIVISIEEYVYNGNIFPLLNNAILREYLFRKISNKDPVSEVEPLKVINKFFDNFTDQGEINKIIEEYKEYKKTADSTPSNYLLQKINEYGLKLEDIKDQKDLEKILKSKGLSIKKRREIIEVIKEEDLTSQLKKMTELLSNFTSKGFGEEECEEVVSKINDLKDSLETNRVGEFIHRIRGHIVTEDDGIKPSNIFSLFGCYQIFENSKQSHSFLTDLIETIISNPQNGDYNFDLELENDRGSGGTKYQKHFRILNHLKSISQVSYENYDVSEELLLDSKLSDDTTTLSGVGTRKYQNIIKLQNELDRKIQHLEDLRENNFKVMQDLIESMNGGYISLEYTKPLRSKVGEISKKAIEDAKAKIVIDSDHSELKKAMDKHKEKAEYLRDEYKENYMFNNPSDDSSELFPETEDGIDQNGFKGKLEEFRTVIKNVNDKFNDGTIDIDGTKVEVATINTDKIIKSQARSKIEIAKSLIEVLNHFKDTVEPPERTRKNKDGTIVVVDSATIKKGVKKVIKESRGVQTLKDLKELEEKLHATKKTTKNRYDLITEKLNEIGLTVDDETKLSDLKDKLTLFSETAGKYQDGLEAALEECRKATEAFNWEAEKQVKEKEKLNTKLYYDLDNNSNEFLEILHNLEESNKEDKNKQNQQGPQHCDLLKYLVSISHRNNNEFDTSILYLISHIPKELTDIISRQRSPHVKFENTITEFVKNLKSDSLDENSKNYLKSISDDDDIIIENVKNLAQQLLSYYQYNKFEVDGRKLNSNKKEKYTFTSSHSTSPDTETTAKNPFELRDNKLQRGIDQFKNDPRSVSEISEIDSNSILQTFGFDDRHQSLSLRHFKFQNIKINNPNLTNAHFRFCDFEGVDFTKLKLEVLEKINFNNCTFTNCDFAEEHIIYLKKLDNNPTQSVNFQNCDYKLSDPNSLPTPSPITKPLKVTLLNTHHHSSSRSIST